MPEHPPAGARPRQAAVLAALFVRDAAPYVVLIRRSEDRTVHSGQISLPGGAREAADASLEQTALREAREEVGIEPGSVDVLGALPRTWIAASGFLVTPYVGWLERPPRYRPDPREVAEVIEAPLAALGASDAIAVETWTLRGRRCRVPFYRVGEHRVWGATARMLAQLAALGAAAGA